MSQPPQSQSKTPRSTPSHLPTSFPPPPDPPRTHTRPLLCETTTQLAPGRSPTYQILSTPPTDSPIRQEAAPSPHSFSPQSTSTGASPSPSPEPRRRRPLPLFHLAQPLGRPTDLPTFLEDIERLKRLIVKAKNTLRREKIAILERELVGGEHGWRVGLAVAYLNGFLRGVG
ncbi:hypothetical protein HOY82DRAFT_542074 [Tuber indicum]|nr:hypothetical protein HOY82DRAFT_542074 [Tuber indicum]